jgi:GntR family transcriptional repressor for pyruvate dehydrogenase complex
MAKAAHTGTISVKPLQRTRMSTRLTEALRELLATSPLRPGDRLPPERSLAAAFAVSRSLVREALRVLEADGWVSVDHGRGIFVGEQARQSPPRPSPALAERDRRFAVALEARHVFEAGLADLIVERATDDDIRQLERIVEDMRRQVQSGEPAVDQDVAFHQQLLRCTSNEILIAIGQSAIIDCLRLTVLERPARSLATPEVVNPDEHARIVELIRGRDAHGLRQYLKATLETYLAILPANVLRG